MDEQQIMDVLLDLLEEYGVQIRREPLGGKGGDICLVGGQKVLFLDTEAPLGERASLCARATGQVINLEEVYLRPQVRNFVHQHLIG